jgi:hypothetical protein
VTDNLKRRGAQDRARISLGEEHEVRFWCGKFGVSKAELEDAIHIVGSSAQAVADFLRKRL